MDVGNQLIDYMAHRYFKNQHRTPMGGWRWEVEWAEPVVTLVGTSFENLVSRMRQLWGANAKGEVNEDEVAKGICEKNPGYCWGNAGGEKTVAAAKSGWVVPPKLAARTQRSAGGCSSCGGGRRR